MNGTVGMNVMKTINASCQLYNAITTKTPRITMGPTVQVSKPHSQNRLIACTSDVTRVRKVPLLLST